jgi:hypothetical protein
MPLLVNESGWGCLFSDVDFRWFISDLTTSGHEDHGVMHFPLNYTNDTELLCRFILPHPPEDGARSSLRNVVGFFVFHIQDDG